jgi:hypothetical protein
MLLGSESGLKEQMPIGKREKKEKISRNGSRLYLLVISRCLFFLLVEVVHSASQTILHLTEEGVA